MLDCGEEKILYCIVSSSTLRILKHKNLEAWFSELSLQTQVDRLLLFPWDEDCVSLHSATHISGIYAWTSMVWTSMVHMLKKKHSLVKKGYTWMALTIASLETPSEWANSLNSPSIFMVWNSYKLSKSEGNLLIRHTCTHTPLLAEWVVNRWYSETDEKIWACWMEAEGSSRKLYYLIFLL